VVMAVVMGVVPTLFLRPMEPAVEKLVRQVQRVQSIRAAAPVVPRPAAGSPVLTGAGVGDGEAAGDGCLPAVAARLTACQ